MSPVSLDNAAAYAFLRAVKGAPLSVLVALALFGRAGASDLEVATGYNGETIRGALRTLAGLGYVEVTARYHGWQLTSSAVQLPLFTPSQLEDGDRGFSALDRGKSALPLLGGGGGLSDKDELTDELLTTTTTTGERGNSAVERGFSALPPTNGHNGHHGQNEDAALTRRPAYTPDADTQRLAEILVRRAQCRRPGALTAVATAHAAGASYVEIEIEILRWAAWYEDARAPKTGLNNPPGYILRKLAEREPAPRGHVVTWSTDEGRIMDLENRPSGDILHPDQPAPDDQPADPAKADPTPAAESPLDEPTAAAATPQPAVRKAEPELDPAAIRAREVWDIARSQLRLQLPQSTYDTWVRDTHCIALTDDACQVICQNAYAREWLHLRLRRIIEQTLTSILGHRVKVEFILAGAERATA